MKNMVLFTVLSTFAYTSCESDKKPIDEPYTVQEVTIQEVTREDSIEEPHPLPAIHQNLQRLANG